MKKILTKICTAACLGFAVAAIAFGSANVKAMSQEGISDEVNPSSAIALTAGETVVVDFDSDPGTDNLYKVTTTQSGILSFKIQGTRYNDRGGIFKYMRVNVYDKNYKGLVCGDVVVGTDGYGTYYAPLPAGTYYVNVMGGGGTYNYFVMGKSNLTYNFEATNQCELEDNNAKNKTEIGKANTILADTVYTGFGGSAGLYSEYKGTDTNDAYKVYLKKGYTYKMIMPQEDKCILRIWGDLDSYGNMFSGVRVNTEFVTKKTGWYYINIWNWLGEQFKYTIEVKTVKAPSPATKLIKVSCKKKIVTVKWSAKSCDGYEIQYSTKSNFKKAKTVTVKSGKNSTKKIKKLKKGKKYYVRIRTYKKFAASTSYSAWTKAKSVKIK